jgi:putative transposase
MDRFGVPEIIHSDNGPEFYNNRMKELSEEFHFKQSFSRPYTPTDNGKMERFYKTIKLENNLFRKLTSKEVKMQARI